MGAAQRGQSVADGGEGHTLVRHGTMVRMRGTGVAWLVAMLYGPADDEVHITSIIDTRCTCQASWLGGWLTVTRWRWKSEAHRRLSWQRGFGH
jgi:hypothetical protein